MTIINGTYNSPLSISIQKEYNAFISLLATLPCKDRDRAIIDGTSGKVSVSDLIAYQIGWGNLLLTWYQAGLKSTMPSMPGEGFSKWDYAAIAQHFYKKYKYDNCTKQEEAFYKTVKEILRITEHEYETGNLDQTGVWEWCTLSSGKQWPLSKWVTVNTVSPYKRARSY